MLRFFKALFPHAVLTLVGLIVGAATGFLFDIQVLRDGGLGPAAAHAGPFVLLLLASVPAFLAMVAGYAGLAVSLFVTLLWALVRRTWRRRTTVRLVTLFGGAWPWINLLRTQPPDGGWTILHCSMVLLLSFVFAGLGFLSGLLLARFLLHRDGRTLFART